MFPFEKYHVNERVSKKKVKKENLDKFKTHTNYTISISLLIWMKQGEKGSNRNENSGTFL